MPNPSLLAAEDNDLGALRAYARTFPSQGGVEIGPWLEEYAAAVPPGAAIVEVGCWLGAGTAHLALGALSSGAEIHCFDRWQANEQEVEKAARFGVTLTAGMDTLPLVRRMLQRIPAPIVYHNGSIKRMRWDGGAVGLYVDDATKVETLWNHAMDVFKPHFIAGKTILVLMDYYFYEKAGWKYGAQHRDIAYRSNEFGEFELIAERMGGTTAAAFRYLG